MSMNFRDSTALTQLQAKRRAAEIEKEAALKECREIRSKLPRELRLIGLLVVDSFRTESMERRSRVSDEVTMEQYLEWLSFELQVRARQIAQYITGDVHDLAVAELRHIAAHHIMQEVSLELVRRRREIAYALPISA